AGLAFHQQRALERNGGIDCDLEIVGRHIGTGAFKSHDRRGSLRLPVTLSSHEREVNCSRSHSKGIRMTVYFHIFQFICEAGGSDAESDAAYWALWVGALRVGLGHHGRDCRRELGRERNSAAERGAENRARYFCRRMLLVRGGRL